MISHQILQKWKLVFQKHSLIKSVIKYKWKFKNIFRTQILLIKVVKNALKHFSCLFLRAR